MVAVPLKEGMSAKELRQAAAGSSDANQARRLLALAAIRDGMSRQVAARIGGMDRQRTVHVDLPHTALGQGITLFAHGRLRVVSDRRLSPSF
jgi:hypothetical protein